MLYYTEGMYVLYCMCCIVGRTKLPAVFSYHLLRNELEFCKGVFCLSHIRSQYNRCFLPTWPFTYVINCYYINDPAYKGMMSGRILMKWAKSFILISWFITYLSLLQIDSKFLLMTVYCSFNLHKISGIYPSPSWNFHLTHRAIELIETICYLKALSYFPLD